jgi:hypothetical protein
MMQWKYTVSKGAHYFVSILKAISNIQHLPLGNLELKFFFLGKGIEQETQLLGKETTWLVSMELKLQMTVHVHLSEVGTTAKAI